MENTKQEFIKAFNFAIDLVAADGADGLFQFEEQDFQEYLTELNETRNAIFDFDIENATEDDKSHFVETAKKFIKRINRIIKALEKYID